ncbi:hypothetical protein HRI_000228800 [Hibiscus trionum]|uniref:Transcription elongation factor 1 homolog n=1 Tax=Hibiscus trionum TaxID=183268 RepID=A0A9W7GTZ9_HIBTR|nr:hypothetical protein HRI_000228800 [Hibiscus trionum]
MGKRKSRAKHAPKKRMDKLDTFSAVPFVTIEQMLIVALLAFIYFSDMKNLISGASCCRICQESFNSVITALTEPIDIYNEWIDKCERVNNHEEEEEEDVDQDDGYVPKKRVSTAE